MEDGVRALSSLSSTTVTESDDEIVGDKPELVTIGIVLTVTLQEQENGGHILASKASEL